jgi:hypothetical protein
LLSDSRLAILKAMRGKSILASALLSLLLASGAARADEIRLKDGTKIIGTIVGFENDSFRVETSYGFALIRKDKVADINITATRKDPEPKAAKVAAPPEPAVPNAAPAIDPAVVKQPASAGGASPSNASADAASITTMRAPINPGTPSNPAAKTDMAPPKIKTVAAEAPAPPVAAPVPPPPPEPPVIHDEIRGNQYVNETYGFQMYRPPSWDLIPAARKALPDAVAALGTSDQNTLLVIGRAPAKDSLDAHATATESALKDVYENYRLISTRTLSVAGVPAIEQRSRGTVDGRDWSVILLTLFKDNNAYTLMGMTWANSDLIQVQENVIAKAVGSFTFVKQ